MLKKDLSIGFPVMTLEVLKGPCFGKILYAENQFLENRQAGSIGFVVCFNKECVYVRHFCSNSIGVYRFKEIISLAYVIYFLRSRSKRKGFFSMIKNFPIGSVEVKISEVLKGPCYRDVLDAPNEFLENRKAGAVGSVEGFSDKFFCVRHLEDNLLAAYRPEEIFLKNEKKRR